MNLCKLNPFFHTLAGLLRKSVQLAEVHLYRIYFLQNPYFSENGHFVNLLSFASSYFFINHMIQQPKAWRHVDHLKWPWKLTRGSNDKAFFYLQSLSNITKGFVNSFCKCCDNKKFNEHAKKIRSKLTFMRCTCYLINKGITYIHKK